MKVVLYAPEDQPHLNRLLPCLRDVQPMRISSLALDTLMTISLQYVILLMSIDLLYRLKCEKEYKKLYQHLKLLEREGRIRIIELRACWWKDSFKRSVVPAEGTILTVFPLEEHSTIYQQIAIKLEEESAKKKQCELLEEQS